LLSMAYEIASVVLLSRNGIVIGSQVVE